MQLKTYIRFNWFCTKDLKHARISNWKSKAGEQEIWNYVLGMLRVELVTEKPMMMMMMMMMMIKSNNAFILSEKKNIY